MHQIKIALDFSTTPGARHRADGPYSGEEFREQHLEPLFKNTKDDSKITIFLDGVAGYATSFLEESFGGLVRMFGYDRVIKRLQLESSDPVLIEEIKSYLEDAKK